MAQHTLQTSLHKGKKGGLKHPGTAVCCIVGLSRVCIESEGALYQQRGAIMMVLLLLIADTVYEQSPSQPHSLRLWLFGCGQRVPAANLLQPLHT
jgi:hypothetical protein